MIDLEVTKRFIEGKDIDEFDKIKILYGNKKRFLQISDNTFFCFYDGFGGQGGEVWERQDFEPYWSDYKFAYSYEIKNNIDELLKQISYVIEKLRKLLNKDLEN